MRAGFRHLMPVMLAVGFFICLSQALLYSSMKEENAGIRILQLKEPYNAALAAGLLKEDQEEEEAYFEFAFWGERQQQVSNPDLNREKDAAVVSVIGNSGLIMESSRILDKNDDGKCLIDRKLSMDLYGDASAVGQKLKLGQKEYEIVGMLYHGNQAVLIKAADEDKHGLVNEPQNSPASGETLDKVALKIPEGVSPQEFIRQFSSRTGVMGDLIPYHLYPFWAKLIARIPPCMVLLYLLIQMGKKMRGQGKSFSPLNLFMLVILGGAGIWILDIHLEISRDMLPSMWSDFDFWSKLWEQKTGELSMLASAKKGQAGLPGFWNFTRVSGYSAAGAFLGFLSFKKLRIEKGLELLGMGAGFLLLSFAFIVIGEDGGIGLVQNRILWMFFPLCFGIKYFLSE